MAQQLFMNGVEMQRVFVNGTEMDRVFMNGTQVFQKFNKKWATGQSLANSIGFQTSGVNLNIYEDIFGNAGTGLMVMDSTGATFAGTADANALPSDISVPEIRGVGAGVQVRATGITTATAWSPTLAFDPNTGFGTGFVNSPKDIGQTTEDYKWGLRGSGFSMRIEKTTINKSTSAETIDVGAYVGMVDI